MEEVKCLVDMRRGESGIVDHLKTHDGSKLQKLMVLGVLPGKDIELLHRRPSYVFQIGHSQAVVDRELAQEIYVRDVKARGRHRRGRGKGHTGPGRVRRLFEKYAGRGAEDPEHWAADP